MNFSKARIILVAAFLLVAAGFLAARNFREAILFGAASLYLVLRPLVSRRLGAGEDDYQSRLRNECLVFFLVGVGIVVIAVLGLTGVVSTFEGGYRFPFWILILCGLAFIWFAERGFRFYRKLPPE
jgi:uncharacterized membrane protein YfcA